MNRCLDDADLVEDGFGDSDFGGRRFLVTVLDDAQAWDDDAKTGASRETGSHQETRLQHLHGDVDHVIRPS